MSLTIKYENVAGTLSSVGSNVVRFGSLALTQNADIGQEAMSELGWDDPDGTWTITGYRVFTVSESAAPSNNQQVYRGRVGSRTYARMPSSRVGAGRRINVELMDQNVLLGWRVMKDDNANRPAETAGDRIRWLVNTRRAPIFAHPTYFANPTTAMDANDYRNQRYNDVLADIANVTGYNFWADYDEGRQRTELFFLDPASTSYTSTLAISNSIGDVDESTVFAPGEDTELTRDPSRIAASVLGVYDGGDVYSTRDSTGNFYAFVDQTYELSNIKSAAKALALNTRYLDDNDEEDDRISTSVIVPAASVNKILHGQRILAKFSHFANEGYGSYTYFRVTKRTVIQDENIGQDYYRLDLELTPTGTTGDVVLETVTLTACNAVIETSERNGNAFSSLRSFGAGETWRWTLTQPTHDGAAVTDSIRIGGGGVVGLGWGASFGYAGWPTGAQDQGFPPPTIAVSGTGTFTVPVLTSGVFGVECKAGYYGVAGPFVDECWQVVFERIL